MSELKTNLITPYAGTTVTMGESGDTVALAAGATATGFGNPYLHTVQTHVIVTSSQAISAGTATNITNLNATITPTAGTKILVTVRWTGEGSHVDMWDTFFGIRRDSTLVGDPAAAGVRPVAISVIALGHGNNASTTPDSAFYQYLDSPSTGSAITYHATILTEAAQTIYNNRSILDLDIGNRPRLTSTITLQEVVTP